MPTLLLTYATRSIAQRIAGLLQASYDVLPATCEEIPSVLANKYLSIPNGKNPVYPHELLKLCLDKEVDVFLPLGLAEIQALQEASLLFEEYGITLLLPELALVEVFTEQAPSSLPLHIIKNGASIINGEQVAEASDHGVYVVLPENTWTPVII